MNSIRVIVAILILSAIASAQPDHDVGVSAIVSPPERTNIFRNHPISIEVTNYGLSPESLYVIMDVYIADS
jgi:hypothetical protein